MMTFALSLVTIMAMSVRILFTRHDRCWSLVYIPYLLCNLEICAFGMDKVYPSQTKILEGGTKDEIRMFEALFKGVSTRFGLRTIEKSVENLDFIFCSSFQNLRLGSINLSHKMMMA